MKNYFILLLVLSCCCLQVSASWQRSVTNYSRHSYKAGNQNWMIEQHANGWIYFANNKGLLEFDGVNWSTYSIDNAKTRAVKQAGDGRIYVGGLGQFGYFVPDTLGRLTYNCLSDTIDRRSAGNIWNIHLAANRVYFQSDRSIFYLENNELSRIDYTHDIMHSAIINNKFYIASEQGLLTLSGNQFTLLPGTRQATQSKVTALLPFNGKILVVTSRNGLYLYEGNTLRRYASEADSFIFSNQLSCAAIKDSLLALGSVQDGVLLLNMRNGESEKISIANGLQNKSVISMLFDRENNLWLGLDNGIDCINLTSPVLFLYSNRSAIGSGYASCLYNQKLYLGTNQGLYVTDYPVKPNTENQPEFVAGTEGQIWTVVQYDDKLFCGGSNSLTIIDDKNIQRIDGIRGVWSVLPLGRYPDTLLAGTYSGLYILKKQRGRWRVANKIENAAYSAKTMYIESSSNAVWVANKESGLYRLLLSDDLTSAQAKNYNSDALPKGNNVYVSQVNNETVISSRNGLFKYNHLKDCLEEYTELEDQLEGKTAYTFVQQDATGNIWYVTNDALRLARFDTKSKKNSKDDSESYLRGYLIEDFENIQVYDTHQAVIGTEEGFALLHYDRPVTRKFPLHLQIRRVYLTRDKDSLIYGRSYSYNDKPLVIPYNNNSLKIEYSANNYDKSLATLYSYRLLGSGNDTWSQYSENNTKEFTNLNEGEYTFKVKILTDKEQQPVQTSFSFQILPPWYRTWQAYVAYAVVILILVLYLYIRISMDQRRAIRQKENEIKMRDLTIDSLEKKNIYAELKIKNDELVRTTLNIVRKNEILQEIREEALVISKSITQESLPNVRRKILGLITNIETNISHDDDLIAFEMSFDTVHHDFFKKLEEKFPRLTRKDRLLCAYIKMDLMSKEIAPLMNISLRGVEISRYRLRKKLGLLPDEQLAEFLQKL